MIREKKEQRMEEKVIKTLLKYPELPLTPRLSG
jgi:hypothetical protein